MTVKRRTVALTVGVILLLWGLMYIMGIDPREQTNIYLIAAMALPAGMSIAAIWQNRSLTPGSALIAATVLIWLGLLIGDMNPLESPLPFVGALVGAGVIALLRHRQQRQNTAAVSRLRSDTHD